MKQTPSWRFGCVCLLLFGLPSLTAAPALPAAAQSSVPRAAVFSDDLPGFDRGLASELATEVRSAGFNTEALPVASLTNESLLTRDRFDLLVLPGARSLPMSAAPAVKHYLETVGNLLALGVPAWSSPVFLVNGRWLSRARYEAVLAEQKPKQIVVDFGKADLSRWKRSVGDASGKANYELADTEHGKALHAVVQHLGGWETLGSPTLSHPFAAGEMLTCFRAKGGPHTRQLAVEWREEDGSRWIATVGLSPEWKNYVLEPAAFKYWPTWPPDGKAQGHFHPDRAVCFTTGLALSHTALEGDEHEYWLTEIGTAPSPFGDAAPPAQADVPVLESLCPTYQCFPVTTPVVVRADREKVPLEKWETANGERPFEALPVKLNAFHPRPRGVGFEQSRGFRWEPLLGAYDQKSDDYRGALGVLLVNDEAPFRGSVWAAFTPEDAAFYRQPLVTNCLHQVLTRMRRGIYLIEGGSEQFTLFDGQQFQVGARVANFSRQTVSNLSVSIAFLDQHGVRQRTVLQANMKIGPGETAVVRQAGLGLSAGETQVSTELGLHGQPLDGLSHEIGVWRPHVSPKFVEARDGGLWLDGRSWKVHGVNYMPSSGIGLAHQRFFEAWLDRGAYDPAVIDRDLRRLKAMNFNAISVFVDHAALPCQHLLDLLRRCDALGLHVNQSLRPASPMRFSWSPVKELIEYYRLAENDTIFAYDLDWEPSHGSHEQQQHAYARAWNDWVHKRYGTIDAAAKAWGVPAPATDADQTSDQGKELTVPPMAQLTADGPWRKLAADYRLFLDGQLREHYDSARQLVRTVDAHHSVSFRMSSTGDPSYNWDNALPYDFYGLAKAVDLWAPEAYGRIGDWDRVKAGEFTAAYARLCDPAKPLVWAEMGYSAWDMNRMAPDPSKLEFEAHFYADFYRMLIASGADGVSFWWYPGGFRRGEDSDFGVINPDGTDRPVTKVIRENGPRFLSARKPGPPNYFIFVDRDRDARGIYGMYEASREDFWKARAGGRRVGLKWAREP